MKMTLRSVFIIGLILSIPGILSAQKTKQVKLKVTPAASGIEKGALFFDKTFVDLGAVEDQENSVALEFSFTNISKVPVKIIDVKASCNCAVPEWPKEPIKLNEKKSIIVRFFPKGLSGLQEKSVTVYTDGQPQAYTIKFNAYVNDKFAQIEKRFPATQGNLRFSTYDVDLKPMFNYSVDSAVVHIHNPTDKLIKISGFKNPGHIHVQLSAMQILPQNSVSVKLKYHAAMAKDYGHRKDDIIIMTDDAAYPEKKIMVSTDINEDFSLLSEKEKAKPPVFEAVTPVVNLDSVPVRSVTTAIFKIKNTGKGPMYIRKAWGSCGCTEVKYDAGKAIKKNKEATITVTYNTTYEMGVVNKKIYVITNTPQQPQHEMLLKANVVYVKKQ